MNNSLVRKCSKGDMDDVCRMLIQWTEEDITYGQVPTSLRALKSKLGQYFFIAEIDGCNVGFIYGSVHKSKGTAVITKGEPYLEIEEIYVKPEFRNKGIGGRLMDNLSQSAQDNGIERFLVYSATKDLDKILKFYRSNSFKSWYVQMFR